MRKELSLARSLAVYYGNPVKLRWMRRFYAQFIGTGDLCFDIGAHVGNRLLIWSTLGARVVAVEPQSNCMRLLQRWYGRRPHVTLVEEAVGATTGQQTLWVSPNAPTVTTLSQAWIEEVRQSASFAHVQWQAAEVVPVTTLDALIARYGTPAFCKIDVEGYELEVLRGLSRALPALSFEYIAAARNLAVACVEQLAVLGEYRYNWSIGEQHRWQSPGWVDAAAVVGMLTALTPEDGSGDIYARLT